MTNDKVSKCEYCQVLRARGVAVCTCGKRLQDHRAPGGAHKRADYLCWSAEVYEGSLHIAACGHENAAASYLMARLATDVVHSNPPDPDKIGVVDVETGECRFVYPRIIVDVVDAHGPEVGGYRTVVVQPVVAEFKEGDRVRLSGATSAAPIGTVMGVNVSARTAWVKWAHTAGQWHGLADRVRSFDDLEQS